MHFALRLLHLLRGRHHLLALAVAAALGHVLLSLVPALLIRQLIGELTTQEGMANTTIAWTVGGVALVALLRAVCLYVDSLLHHVAAYGMLAELRIRLYDHLQRLSHAYYSRHQTGALVNTVVNDVDTIEVFVAHSISQLVIGLFVPLGIAIILLIINWRLALLAIVMMPLAAVLLLGVTPTLRAHMRAVRSELSHLNALIQDSLAGISVIKAFTGEQERRQMVAVRSIAFERSIVRALIAGTWPTALSEFVAGLATVLVLAVGAAWAAQGQFALADLFVFLVYLTVLYRPLIELAHANDGLQSAMAAAERVFAVLDERPTVTDRPGVAIPRPTPAAWPVAFERVSFAYEPGRPVLTDVSFTIGPGQIVALVGHSGAGKSTIAALLQRFYDVDAGAVRLAGHDVRDLPLAWLRAQISTVLQDVFLFHGSVRDNLVLGRPTATAAELEAASRAAHAHDFIMDLPIGYDTIVGERGVRLSGGQKQRLAIARALLKDAPLLILDEATSSIDVATEVLIQAAMERLLERRTTLVIAHRLSTIRHADHIVVLAAGRIVEVGKHDELLSRGGLYADLYRAQLVRRSWEIAARGTRDTASPADGAALGH